ncbi:hypothetical protein D9M70_517920 [compost metagenome]
MLVALNLEEGAGVAIDLAKGQVAIPGPGRHVGDGVFGAGQEPVVGKMTVEHVELALHFHGVAIDGVFDLHRRIGIEMTEAAAQERCRAHLPEQPV